nr:Bcr/CflA family efflux MFS transporter [uncultured Candidatus Microthrix sp.]
MSVRVGATPARSEVAVVAFLAFVSVLMAFGIDAALPAFDELRQDFGLDARGLSPAITGTPYFVGMAIGQLIFGVLADRFGRRPIMMVGLSVYALGALGAATANGLGMLLVGRFIWGLGAAAPAVLRMAIARDLYAGERMARVVSLVTAVFLIGPIVVPFIGEWILLTGSWRAVFAVAIALAAVALAWAFAFGETLAPEHRQPLRIRPITRAFAAVVTTRVTLWAIIAQAFFGAAFFIWLGSAQPVIDRIYGRSSQFTLLFGLSGVGMAAALLVNNRLISRFGVRPMAVRAAWVFVLAGLAGLAVAIAWGGVPPLWAWFAWALVANAMSMIMTPMCAAIALGPMADQAGMASAVLGLGQLGVGALLAALVDARIGATVTPMLVGATVFGAAGLGALLWSGRGS